MTLHTSPERESTMYWLSFLWQPLQSSTRVPMFWASQRMLIYHHWACIVTFDCEILSAGSRAKHQDQSRDTLPAGEPDQTISLHWFIQEKNISSLNLSFARFKCLTFFDFLYINRVFFSSRRTDVQQRSVTATLSSLHPDPPTLKKFPNRPRRDGDGANCWECEFSCPGPNSCQDLAPLQHKRYECSAAVDCQDWLSDKN